VGRVKNRVFSTAGIGYEPIGCRVQGASCRVKTFLAKASEARRRSVQGEKSMTHDTRRTGKGMRCEV
jgi:hypothetical protein